MNRPLIATLIVAIVAGCSRAGQTSTAAPATTPTANPATTPRLQVSPSPQANVLPMEAFTESEGRVGQRPALTTLGR